MMLLKACPKCLGALVLDRDMYGRYFMCLQCGFMRDIMEHYYCGSCEVEPSQELPDQELEVA